MTGWAGGTFGERARCVLAPNPGMMTLAGTNTWVLREPGGRRSVVVDPGPLDDAHLDAVDDGRLAMLPPTYATCLELYEFGSSASALAAAAQRDRTPILPEMQVDEDGGMLRLPDRLVALGESVAARRRAAGS